MAKQGRRKGGRPRKGVSISVKPAPRFIGDHGTGTKAGIENTEIVAVKDDANGMGRRQKINVLERLAKDDQITQRQFQAGEAIATAYCRVQMLSSGGAIGERVQSSPKPDAAVARQVDAISAMVKSLRAVPIRQRPLVEHVCWHNQPLRTSGIKRAMGRLCDVLDLVADHLGY